MQDANITPTMAMQRFLEIIEPMTPNNRDKFIEGLITLYSPLGRRIMRKLCEE